MKKSKKTKSKSRAPVAHAYQSNPYALQRRNAAPAPVQLVAVSPVRRAVSGARKVVSAAKARGKTRLSSSDFVAQTGLAFAGAGSTAVAMSLLTSIGVDPLLTGLAATAIGAGGAVFAPPPYQAVGVGVGSVAVGQMAVALTQKYRQRIDERKKEAEKEQAAKASAHAEQEQRALPAGKPSNAAFLPSVSDAFASARSYGSYGRADDEERMTDLDLVLG